jgi:hypothetical protein
MQKIVEMIKGLDTCRVCGKACANVTHSLGGGSDRIECSVCGQYEVATVAWSTDEWKSLPKHLWAGLLRNVWEIIGTPFFVKGEMINSVETLQRASPIAVPNDTDIPAKADFILRHLRRKSNHAGQIVELSGATDYSVGFCHNESEFRFCLEYLAQRQFVMLMPKWDGQESWDYRITPAGWAYLAGVGAESKEQGFIAMAFQSEFSDELNTNGLKPGVAGAGYLPLRIDSKEHNNRIDDEIVAEIRKSRFVVADLTGKNAGAYFEAGFAMGLGRPVIWTCEQSEIDANKVHFDTRQYSIVPWTKDKWPDFAKRLTQRIEATLGRGQYKAEA